jgi:ferredoxin-NADP reductase
MAAEMSSLKIVHVMSNQDDWPGEKGYVDEEKLKTYISNLESQFFICGPPRMMLLVEKALKNLGVPRKRIHYERFALR